jgi:RNA polymerase sigma-70 factor (ECF subfamily)
VSAVRPDRSSDVALSRLFREGGAGALPMDAVDDGELGAALRRVLTEGEGAFPGVALPLEELVRRLAARGAPIGRAPALHAADLYLACACEARVRGAVEAFERAYLTQLGASLARLRLPEDAVDEVRQVLREKLLVGSRGAAPKIAEYDGRGALASWVRVIALRVAIDLRRQGSRAAEQHGPRPDERAALDPETGYLKTRYRSALGEAIRDAVRALGAEERETLRLHFVDGLSLDRQAEVLGIHRATVARRLAATRRALKVDARRRLRAALGVSEAEVDSVIRLVRSQIDLSLPALLREG